MEIANYKEWFQIGILIAMGVYWTLMFTVLYHLIRFGVGTLPKKIAIVFLAGGIVLSMVTILFFAEIINI